MFVISLPNKSGIYAIINKSNNKKLICFSKNMKHNASLCLGHLNRSDGRANDTMQIDWDLDSSSFTIELLELTDDKNRLDYYIRKYNSINDGYNTKYKSATYLYNHLPNKSGVYMITNMDSLKSYIGFSKDIKRRVRDHFGLLRLGEHYTKQMQQDWNKGDQFTAKVLELTTNQKREEYYIFEIETYKHGYNILIGNVEKYNGQLLRQD